MSLGAPYLDVVGDWSGGGAVGPPRSPHADRVLRLYRRILLVHLHTLPVDCRMLGDAYVSEEFRLHKTADEEVAAGFLEEWERYLGHLVASNPRASERALRSHGVQTLRAGSDPVTGELVGRSVAVSGGGGAAEGLLTGEGTVSALDLVALAQDTHTQSVQARFPDSDLSWPTDAGAALDPDPAGLLEVADPDALADATNPLPGPIIGPETPAPMHPFYTRTAQQPRADSLLVDLGPEHGGAAVIRIDSDDESERLAAADTVAAGRPGQLGSDPHQVVEAQAYERARRAARNLSSTAQEALSPTQQHQLKALRQSIEALYAAPEAQAALPGARRAQAKRLAGSAASASLPGPSFSFSGGPSNLRQHKTVSHPVPDQHLDRGDPGPESQ